MSDATAQITFAELATTGRSPRDWIRERCDEMRAAGVTHLRVTDLKEHDLLLLEGWLVVPEVAPEPAPFLRMQGSTRDER